VFANPPTTFRLADDRIDPLVKTLRELGRYAETGDIISALQICAQMKKDGVRPNLRVYEYLCKIFASKALWPEVTALCYDAVAVGLTLDITMYNWRLAVSRYFLIVP
jgi:pentatricopeptide repeat protein